MTKTDPIGASAEQAAIDELYAHETAYFEAHKAKEYGISGSYYNVQDLRPDGCTCIPRYEERDGDMVFCGAIISSDCILHGTHVSLQECERRVKEARERALEDAALIFDELIWCGGEESDWQLVEDCKDYQRAIRALKDSSHD